VEWRGPAAGAPDARVTPVHFFVFTLGFSRRAVAYAYRNERLDTLLDGHERALRHFGGVPLSCLYDNPRTITLGRSAGQVLWHPRFEDFARYYGFTPRACQPYRARTKGQGRERREVREAQRPGGPPVCELVRAGGVARGMGGDRVRRARAWHDARAADRSFRPRDADPGRPPAPVSLRRASPADRRRRCAGGDRGRAVLGPGPLCRPDRRRPRDRHPLRDRRRRHVHRAACQGRPARGRHRAGALPGAAATGGSSRRSIRK
jgi:hypothetical protein